MLEAKFVGIILRTKIARLPQSKHSVSLRMTVPFVTAHLEIFHCTHHPVIPEFDLYFTFCFAPFIV